MSSIKIEDMKEIDVDSITELPTEYPKEFIEFCSNNNIKPPKITTSKRGKALAVMLKYKHCYWTRESCDRFVKKFKIPTKDSIQLFNKHSQSGIQTNSGTVKGKLYIVYPYCLSKKHKMRKGFKFDGTEEQKNKEIEKIKSTIRADYIDTPNSQWQLGHKNPDSIDNTMDNLVLQPPIQGKYRDLYIFIDTLTKFPTPHTLKRLLKNGDIKFTKEQIISFIQIFNELNDDSQTYKNIIKSQQEEISKLQIQIAEMKLKIEKMTKKRIKIVKKPMKIKK